MGRQPYPNQNRPQVTEEGGSHRITIPKGIRDALGIEPGEEPEYIEFDSESREFAMRFAE